MQWSPETQVAAKIPAATDERTRAGRRPSRLTEAVPAQLSSPDGTECQMPAASGKRSCRLWTGSNCAAFARNRIAHSSFCNRPVRSRSSGQQEPRTPYSEQTVKAQSEGLELCSTTASPLSLADHAPERRPAALPEQSDYFVAFCARLVRLPRCRVFVLFDSSCVACALTIASRSPG